MTSDFDVNLNVLGCNNNSICEAVLEEDSLNCPLDCLIQDDEEDDRSGRSGSKINFEYPVYVNLYPEISSIKAVVENKNVYLYWSNPNTENFNFVRIIKNKEYSESPYDGEVVYEGSLDNFKDFVSDFDKDYFYNFFARYKDGNFSKGVGFVINSPTPSISEDINTEVKEVDFEYKPQEPVIFSEKFNIYDLIFIQDNIKLRWKDNTLIAYSRNGIDVLYPKKDFFGELENVYLYLSYYDLDGKFFRKDVIKMDYSSLEQSYITRISEISNVSRLDFRFSIIDKNREESFVQSSLKFEEKAVEISKKDDYFLWIIFVSVILILLLFFKAKKRDN
jgi:hypothetical protein